MNHAWVEWRGWCYDPHLQLKWRKADYYEQGQIDPKLCRYYTKDEALQLFEEQRNYGCWHPVPSGATYRYRGKIRRKK